MRVISAARWLTTVEISSALPTKLRATSALSASSPHIAETLLDIRG